MHDTDGRPLTIGDRVRGNRFLLIYLKHGHDGGTVTGEEDGLVQVDWDTGAQTIVPGSTLFRSSAGSE